MILSTNVCLIFFSFFPSHLSIKIGKVITYSEVTSACMCLIWEGKGHFAC